MSLTTGGSLTGFTVNVAGSLSESKVGSVAVKVIVSLPFQLSSGVETVATCDDGSMETIKSLLPEYVQVISSSELSASVT